MHKTGSPRSELLGQPCWTRCWTGRREPRRSRQPLVLTRLENPTTGTGATWLPPRAFSQGSSAEGAECGGGPATEWWPIKSCGLLAVHQPSVTRRGGCAYCIVLHSPGNQPSKEPQLNRSAGHRGGWEHPTRYGAGWEGSHRP